MLQILVRSWHSKLPLPFHQGSECKHVLMDDHVAGESIIMLTH
jgi:hypothetical protein